MESGGRVVAGREAPQARQQRGREACYGAGSSLAAGAATTYARAGNEVAGAGGAAYLDWDPELEGREWEQGEEREVAWVGGADEERCSRRAPSL